VPSTLTAALATVLVLPTRSATVRVTVPAAVSVTGSATDAGSTPVPAVPSRSSGSPSSVVVRVTASRYQPPSPAKSGARSVAIDGACGADWSTTTGSDAGDHAVSTSPSTPLTR
jgi:hypothetical protein